MRLPGESDASLLGDVMVVARQAFEAGTPALNLGDDDRLYVVLALPPTEATDYVLAGLRLAPTAIQPPPGCLLVLVPLTPNPKAL